MYTNSKKYQQYNDARNLLEHSINNDDNIIILYGNGGNGKTHITKEMINILNEHDYNIIDPKESYKWDKTLFRKNVLFSPDNKKIIHLLFNPFYKWNIPQPKYISNINMSHIHW
tara:strand:+ start:206 stop:547 length:342 start_codon:yes stop_codon:yes gene_type:complete